MKKMKKFLSCLMLCFLSALLGAALYQTALEKGWYPPDKADCVNETDFEDVLACEPSFKTATDVIAAQAESILQFNEDSVFRSIPSDQLYNVACVVINRDGVATIHSIASEYRANITIYSALPTSSTVIVNSPATTSDENPPSNKESPIVQNDSTVKDKTIN